MEIITLLEIFDLVFMTVMLGLIFMYVFKRFTGPEAIYTRTGFDFNAFKMSVIVVAPAILLHELGHKFVALFYGIGAVFHAAYIWLFIGLALSMANFGFIFFIPGYVSISPVASPLQSALIAATGPFMNLVLWVGAAIAIKYRLVNKKYLPLVFLTKQINMFLFIFNMIPFGIFDGAKVFSGLYTHFLM